MEPIDADGGPGVPEAVPRAIRELERRMGASAIDSLWIFPPLVRGRREWGLVAAGCFDGADARRLVTAGYAACRTGRGLHLDCKVRDEGVAPPDRLPRVMHGVARRGPAPLGAPRLVELGGASEAWDGLRGEFPESLLAEAVVGPPPPDVGR